MSRKQKEVGLHSKLYERIDGDANPDAIFLGMV